MTRLFSGTAGAILLTGALYAQPPIPSDPQPIYRVTVVSRSLQAVNYEHRGGPTPIDFGGTVLLPEIKGTAIVDSHRGAVAIDAKLEHLQPPTRFGREYLTYVLWAISPEGRPRNLGEVLVDGSNKAHLKVTTDMQAFGLMITAEPYYSVTTPSDVVVAENIVRPDTIGAREEVMARYELLPRGQYTMTVEPAHLRYLDRDAESLPYDRYEAVLELYQAENAVQIARSMDADRYAPESFDKAAALLSQARDMQARRMDTHAIVSAAREATQMAEDARSISVKRRDEDRRARDLEQARDQRDRTRQAEADAAQARADADRLDAERIQAERARADAEQAAASAEQQAAQASRQAAIAPRAVLPQSVRPDVTATQRHYRAQLYAQLNRSVTTRDTPRGLVIIISDSMFEPGNERLRGNGAERLSAVAAVLSSNPELQARVEGFADSDRLSDERAQAVRSALIARGARSDISAVGFGKSRPVASPSSSPENRRVEVVVYGSSIGQQAVWDRPYPLQSQR
jgi:outer membrane protein OmpA-like peptidoglycan-associated protein